MRNIIICSIILAWASLILINCSPKKAPAITPVPASSSGKVVEASDWSNIMTEAKKEKKVVLYMVREAAMRIALTGGFPKKYGVELEAITGGRDIELTQKISSERRAGLYIVDLYASGASAAILTLKPGGLLIPMDSALILPEVRDPKFWYGNKLPWVDKDHTTFSMLAYQSGEIAINTNLVKPGEIKEIKDLLNPKWKGKIILNDPTVSGTGSKFVAFIAYKYGWDFWSQMLYQEPSIIRDERIMMDWLAQGKYAIVVVPRTETFNALKGAGAPIEQIALQGGVYLTGDVISIMKDSPHPNASKVFLNWLLGPEGQTVWSKTKGAQSARVDIKVEGIKERKIGFDYFNSNDEEFIIQQDMRRHKEMFAPLIKG